MIQQKRTKSLIMWCGIISTAFISVGIDWHNFTSWYALGQAFLDVIKNPAMIIALVINIISQANNPTNRTGF